MTTIQSFMLSICFGAVMGAFIGNAAMLIKFAVEDHKEKKRRKKEESADKEE